MPSVIDERALSKLRWRCRRGLLENDLFVERFFNRCEGVITEQQAEGLNLLMDLADNDLLDLLLRRTEPQGELACMAVIEVLASMRMPAFIPFEEGPSRVPAVETIASQSTLPPFKERP
jgi:antitoxin CptB